MHTNLFQDIESKGISGKTLSWIRESLHRRRQKVVINGQPSSWYDIKSGVPQGLGLGTIIINK